MSDNGKYWLLVAAAATLWLLAGYYLYQMRYTKVHYRELGVARAVPVQNLNVKDGIWS